MKAVEDGLRRLDGVDRIEIDLQTNLVTIRPDSGLEYDLRVFPRAIRDSGFRPGQMRIRARGALGPDGRTFRIHGWSQVLPLTGSPRVAAEDVGVIARVSYDNDLKLHEERSP